MLYLAFILFLSFVTDHVCNYLFLLQRKKGKALLLSSLRQTLLDELIDVVPKANESISENQIINASSFVRLYCALKGMAAFK